MTLTSGIIAAAYRESNTIAKGATPDSAQVAEALALLQVLVSGVMGYEVGRNFIDWPVGREGVNTLDQTVWNATDWCYPSANVRLIAASATPQTIYMHPHPSDGARMMLIDPASRLSGAPITLDGNGRTVEGSLTVTKDANGVSSEWLYRADKGDWVLVADLTAVDPEQFPFPVAFDTYFITRLAMRLNPRYGRAMDVQSKLELDKAEDKLRAQYIQNTPVWPDAGVSALTQGYGSLRSGRTYGDLGGAHPRRLLRPPHYEG